jgi:hypothetical protein
MTALARALRAETLKMKRTLALWLAIITPLGMVGLQFLNVYQRAEYYLRQIENAWVRFGQEMFVVWGFLMVPLFVTLQTALLSGLEHRSDQWKHLYALPLPRWTVYAAKQLAGMALIGLSMVGLVGFSVLAGLVLRVLKPGIGLDIAIPWELFLRYGMMVYLASWLIISLHTWVAMRWRSFVVAMAVGILMTAGGMVVINADWATFYPWALPGLLANTFNKGEPILLKELTVSIVGGIAVALLGCWEVIHRDVL